MNESDLQAAGFIRRPDGEWEKPRRTAVRDRDSGAAAIVERASRNAALLPTELEKPLAERVWIRVTSFRRRLLDEDNLSAKAIVDCCRYAGLIRSDAPGEAKIEVAQEKVGSKEPEFVRIQIFRR